MKKSNISILIFMFISSINSILTGLTYPIVDTNQNVSYNQSSPITTPLPGQNFYGQDAQYQGNQPAYMDNGDGTVTDLVTGLMWQKSPDRNSDGLINYSDKLFYAEAVASADTLSLCGYNDWRLPNVKELYSLIMYNGFEMSPTATTSEGYIPYINTDYFVFGYGDLSADERLIDAQYASSTVYVSTTMNGNATMFGVNFADGRIKGYPISQPSKKYYVLYVRGNPQYGQNNFVDNGDNTISDLATGLMWMKNDNGVGVNWESALSAAENYEFAGYSDWRLPNAKELQSLVDYTRSPATTNSPAISEIFNSTSITNEAGQIDYPFIWSSTSFLSMTANNASKAVYVSFGRAMGYMAQFGGWIDVHGAGAQRSDPKIGNPDDYPQGHGPQGDATRIFNYVRLVRDMDSNSNDDTIINPQGFQLKQNYPNPFNPDTTIEFYLDKDSETDLVVFNVKGQIITKIHYNLLSKGKHTINWRADQKICSGLYFCRLNTSNGSQTIKMMLLK